jgi:hypothetical protein
MYRDTSIRTMPGMADGAEPKWFEQLRAATTSWTRFSVLAHATTGRLTIAGTARLLNCDPKGAEHHLRALLDAGLLAAPAAEGGFKITADGERTCAVLRSAAGDIALLRTGVRLLGVKYGASHRNATRRRLEERAEALLRTDGDFDLLAILPDDPDIVADLESAVRTIVADTVRLRVAETPSG